MDDLTTLLAPHLDPALAESLRRVEPLASHTTLRVGGPADLFFAARTADELADVVAAAQHVSVPYFLLGGGSNVCISDKGFRGLVILNLAESCEIGTTTHVV